MSFDSYEISNSSGRLLYFYEFHWGNSSWFFTSAPDDKTLEGENYESVAITHGDITSGGDNPGQLKITADPSLAVVDLFRGSPPSDNVQVVIRRKHVDDAETVIVFAGKIDNVKRMRGGARAEILCSIGRLRRGGLRLTWSRSCPHILYDGQCRLNKADFADEATVLSVTGNTVTLTAAPNASASYYDGGIIEWDADGLGTMERRAIERGISTTEILLFGRADGIEPDQTVFLFPGCDRSSSTCNTKFNNLVNYGGITQMPGESPYGQNIF